MANSSDNQELPLTSAGTEVENDRKSVNDGGETRYPNSAAPLHPIPQLQGPFEESIYEAIQGTLIEWEVDLDAQTRRRDLLENPQYERLCGRKWRQRADERYHPFWKLTAQISFGLYLLTKKMAKSNTEVLRILQAHVDEVDGFISRATEDFLIIQIDLRTRIQYLSLPLQNLDVFDEMLEDRGFRLAMLDYNERIEHAVERFTTAINDSLKDIQKGKEAIGGLWHYLQKSSQEHSPLSQDLTAIYKSMLSNTEGWNAALSKLRRKGAGLQSALAQLGGAVAEMQRRVCVASRKEVISFVPPSYGTPRAKSLRERFFNRNSSIGTTVPILEKPLPRDPFSQTRADSRPTSWARTPHKLAQKSVPNLRAIQESDKSKPPPEPLSTRAKSVSCDPDNFDRGPFVPRIQRNLTRRFSMAKLSAKQPVEDLTEIIPSRPSTAASRVLRSFRKSKLEIQSLPDTQHKRPNTSNSPARQDLSARQQTMKNQLMNYIKSDRVLDVWENMAQKEKRLDQPATQNRMDGLWSKFHAKPSSMPSDGIRMSLTQEDIQRQLAWLQDEAKAFNTYSLKPKQNTAPKLHVFSVQMSLQQEPDEKESCYINPNHAESIAPDAQFITALPSIPAPLAMTTTVADSVESHEYSNFELRASKDYYIPRVEEKSIIVS